MSKSGKITRFPNEIVDEFNLTEDRFWELVAIADWPNLGYDEPKVTYLETVRSVEGIEFRRMIGRVWSWVDHIIGPDRNPACGGDDSHSDFIYHLIGIGKEQFYAHVNDYELMEKRGDAHDYKESFGYAIPYIEEWQDPKKTLARLKRQAEEDAKREVRKAKADAEGRRITRADTVIYEIGMVLSEADGKFIEKIANQVLSGKVEYIEDEDVFEMEDIR